MSTILGHLYWYFSSLFIVFAIYEMWPINLLHGYFITGVIVVFIISWLVLGMNDLLSNLLKRKGAGYSDKHYKLVKYNEMILHLAILIIWVQKALSDQIHFLLTSILIASYLIYLLFFGHYLVWFRFKTNHPN